MNSRSIKILITGANGFVGAATSEALIRSGFDVLRAVRKSAKSGEIAVGAVDEETDWAEALIECNVVIHCAARVHMLQDAASDPLTEYRKVNVAGTINLARQAARAGVNRFVFLSSIKVNGEVTYSGGAYTDHDIPAPKDAYGISKAEAEVSLRLLSLETGMEVVIIRPPLVYGPGVKGNFLSLLNWVTRGIPLPLGLVTANRRSFVGLDNLVDLILTCVDHSAAANQTFLVSDGEDLSTAELLQRMAKAVDRPSRLVPVPVSLLLVFARLLGKTAFAQRLLGSLQVDISKTCELLDWKPPVSVDMGLRRAAQQRM